MVPTAAVVAQPENATTHSPISAATAAPAIALFLAAVEFHQGREADAALAELADVDCEAACKMASLVACKSLQERDSDSNMSRAFEEPEGRVGEN